MQSVFSQYSEDFTQIALTLEQKFRRSYRASDQESKEAVQSLKEAESKVRLRGATAPGE